MQKNTHDGDEGRLFHMEIWQPFLALCKFALNPPCNRNYAKGFLEASTRIFIVIFVK